MSVGWHSGTGMGIARGLWRLRRGKRAAVAPVPQTVPEERAALVPEPGPTLTACDAARLARLAEEAALASPGAAEWGTILATGLRKVMPDQVSDAHMALVLFHVDGFLGAVLESTDDYQTAVMSLGDGLRCGAAELAAMELAILATEGGGPR